jgi:hypothetical protein
MIPQRISVKYFVQESAAVEPAAFIPVFHRWIQEQVVPGLLIDVASYAHVPGGPGVLLIGHEGDYALDLGGGRPGLRYTRKRGWDDPQAGDPAEILAGRLWATLVPAILATRAIEADPALGGRLRFDGGELRITFADRLRTPNEPAVYSALVRPVTAALAALYPGSPVGMAWASAGERGPLAFRVRVAGAPSLAAVPALARPVEAGR